MILAADRGPDFARAQSGLLAVRAQSKTTAAIRHRRLLTQVAGVDVRPGSFTSFQARSRHDRVTPMNGQSGSCHKETNSTADLYLETGPLSEGAGGAGIDAQPLGVRVKPSSSQPVTPPIIILTGSPRRESRTAALFAPLQCGPAQ